MYNLKEEAEDVMAVDEDTLVSNLREKEVACEGGS